MKCFECGENAVGVVGYNSGFYCDVLDLIGYCKKHFFQYCHDGTQQELKEEREPKKPKEEKKGWF